MSRTKAFGTHAAFATGPAVRRPLTEEAVARLRVVAAFFDFVGPDDIADALHRIIFF